LKLFRFYGTGTHLLDYREVSPGIYEASQWISLFFVPIIPLSSWKVRPKKSSPINLGSVVGSTFNLDVLERLPLSGGRVLRTYAMAITTVAIAISPFLVVKAHFPKDRKPTPLEVATIMLAAAWPVGVLAMINRRQERIYGRQ